MTTKASTPARTAQSGITLIELLVVIVIVGILAGIAYPSYRKQVVRSKRTDAKISLQQSALALENCFTRFHSYTAAAGCTAMDNLSDGIASVDGHYEITVENEGDLTFTLIATPQGGQTVDTECANFILDQASAKDVSGTKGGTPAGVAECWR